MAAVTRDTGASLDASTGAFANQISGLIAGEDIVAGAVCRINGADGKIYNSNGVALGAAAVCLVNDF